MEVPRRNAYLNFVEQTVHQQPVFNSEAKITRKGFIELEGEVTEALPNAMFRVKLDSGHLILGILSGRMKINRIMLLPGDRVRMEMSPYDLSKGRIVYRF